MTVHQAAVLLCFNGLVSSNVESCTVEDIENASQLKNDLLYKNIKSLIDSGLLKSVWNIPLNWHNFCRAYLLYLQPQDNLINSTQLFINKDFSSKRSKFKLSIPAAQKQVEKVKTFWLFSHFRRQSFMYVTVFSGSGPCKFDSTTRSKIFLGLCNRKNYEISKSFEAKPVDSRGERKVVSMSFNNLMFYAGDKFSAVSFRSRNSVH